jgi:hypothetical protein
MARRFAAELRGHWFNTEEHEEETCYMVSMPPIKGTERWFGTIGKKQLFRDATRFDTREKAEAHMNHLGVKYLEIQRIDAVLSDIVYGFTYELSNAEDCYSAHHLCSECGKNAAIKVTYKKTRNRPEARISYIPCRLCSNKYDDNPEATDFLGGDSPIAAMQDLEPTPTFTKRDMELVSRAAAKRRILPQFRPEGL